MRITESQLRRLILRESEGITLDSLKSMKGDLPATIGKKEVKIKKLPAGTYKIVDDYTEETIRTCSTPDEVIKALEESTMFSLKAILLKEGDFSNLLSKASEKFTARKDKEANEFLLQAQKQGATREDAEEELRKVYLDPKLLDTVFGKEEIEVNENLFRSRRKVMKLSESQLRRVIKRIIKEEGAGVARSYQDTEWSMDRWMPEDMSVQNEYNNLVNELRQLKASGDEDAAEEAYYDLLSLLKSEADRESLERYLPPGGNLEGFVDYLASQK